MKNVFFALTFMLMGALAFANNAETTITEENVISLNEMSKIDLTEESVFIKLNSSSEVPVGFTCYLAKKWVKNKLNGISDDNELIDEIGDAVYELCEIAKDLKLF